MIKRMWMVRSDAGRFYNDFQESEYVAIGWSDIDEVKPSEAKNNLIARLALINPHSKPGSIQSAASQILRFLNEIKVGDDVVTYEPGLRIYLLGEIIGGPIYDSALFGGELPRARKVKWRHQIARDSLTSRARNTLGSTLTLFEVSADVADELRALPSHSPSPAVTSPAPLAMVEDAVESFRDQEIRAIELIKDSVNTLDWEDMQELVAGILRAMGYKTQVSPSGPDRGKDIVASPDGFGFENPRIVVEVKHRKGAMGAQQVRSFLGGRHKDDRGLYVSTGGFSKDAHYEAERASVATALWNLDDLVRALVEHYEQLDNETKRLVPLRRVYWPG